MMANTGVTTISLLCVVHIYCVLGRQNKELVFTTERSSEIQNVTVNLGSNVTFSCLNSWSYRTSWYKTPSSGKAAAFVDKRKDGCVLHNENYPSISQGRCSDDYSGITFNSIQYTDSGIWWCTIDVSNTLLTSQYVFVEVKENVAWTTPFQVSTSQTTKLVPTRPTTTPRVNTKRPGITGTSQPPTPTPTRAISNTRSTSGCASSTVTSKAATSSSNQTVITGRPGIIGGKPTDEGDTSTSRSYLIPVVAGVCGVTVFIVVVVAIVIIKLRATKYSQTGGGRQHNGSFNGEPAREEVNFEAECGGIGLEYAQLSVTPDSLKKEKGSKTSDNWTINNYHRHDNGSMPQRNDEEDDELVMADNPIYMSYDQEEKTGNKSHTPAVSVYDKVPDVYSVVQKVRKSQADCSAQQKTDGQKPTETDDGMSNIYSLEKKTT